jgi:1,2-diacylglycerol 3-alpha-glucosyltransferase
MLVMKIAVLFETFGPYHIARLAAASRVATVMGIEVARHSPDYSWLPVDGAEGFQRVVLDGELRAPSDRARRAARLEEALTNFQPDSVAIPGWSSQAALLALRWSARSRVPAVVMSESQASDGPRNRFKEWIKSRCVAVCRSALLGGRSHRAYLIQLGMPANRCFLGYDAVDNEHFARMSEAAKANAHETRSALGLPARYFLASSRFIPKKNLPFLLRAFARYRRGGGPLPWDLVLLGDGPLRPEITALIAQLDLKPCVHLPGFRQYDELPAYYGLAGAFIHASTTEQWGLVVNEAMASGLPVLVSNRCGSACELVSHAGNGFQFDPTDEAALARYMADIAHNDCRRAGMGLASRERIRPWGPERFACGLLEAAQAAVAQGPATVRRTDRILLYLLGQRRNG